MADAASFDKRMAAEKSAKTECKWYEVECEEISVGGLGFFEKEHEWSRLPIDINAQMLQIRPAVTELASHMAGASLNFCTNSPEIFVHAVLNKAPYMSHMTACAQCGLDCYIRLKNSTEWLFAGVTKFALDENEICCSIVQKLPPNTQVCINLPLYIGIQSIAVGITNGYEIHALPKLTDEKSVAFYGTSITQGGCASRPGMTYPSIIGRKLGLPIYNLGFSGNGVANSVLASAICDLPRLGALVIDIEPNAGPEGLLRKNLPLFIDEIRKTSKTLPLLILSGSYQTQCGWDEELRSQCQNFASFEQKLVQGYISNGDKHIFFADAKSLIGAVGAEGTVDGVHLTDLAFYAMAQSITPILQTMLALEG